jgi:DNA repair protein RadC
MCYSVPSGDLPMSTGPATWKHPGGKLRELGADKLDESELLAVVISTGTKGRPAMEIARDLLRHFGSLAGLANQPLERLLSIRGLGDVKILRIAAALEIARRTANEIVHGKEDEAEQAP